MAQPSTPNHGWPRFNNRHLERGPVTQRQTNPCDMLVYVQGVENPSHTQRAKIAASNAVTHPQWASTAYYAHGTRDLWVGGQAALAFMQGYDRLTTTAADSTETIKWFERTFEAQDREDWLSPALKDILGEANVQGRSKKELFQDLTHMVRNWTAVRFRNLHHCLHDDIVRLENPHVHRWRGQKEADKANGLVHDSDIVGDAILCRAPDFTNGHHSGTHPDTQTMPYFYQALYSIPVDLALAIGRYRGAHSPQQELFTWIEGYINVYHSTRSQILEAIRINRLHLVSNWPDTWSAREYNNQKRPFLERLNRAYEGVVDTVTSLVKDRRTGPTVSRQTFDTLESRVSNLNREVRTTRLLDRLPGDRSRRPDHRNYLGTGNHMRAIMVQHFPQGVHNEPPRPAAHAMHDGNNGGDGGGGGGGGYGGGPSGGPGGGSGGQGGSGSGIGDGNRGQGKGGSHQGAWTNRFAALAIPDDTDMEEAGEAGEAGEGEKGGQQGPRSPPRSTEVPPGSRTGGSSSRSGSRPASMAGSRASSGDSVFGEKRGRRRRRRDAVPVLGARNYSKGHKKVEKPPQRQSRSRKVDVDVMLLSTWRSQDVDIDGVVPRTLPARRRRNPSWRRLGRMIAV